MEAVEDGTAVSVLAVVEALALTELDASKTVFLTYTEFRYAPPQIWLLSPWQGEAQLVDVALFGVNVLPQ